MGVADEIEALFLCQRAERLISFKQFFACRVEPTRKNIKLISVRMFPKSLKNARN